MTSRSFCSPARLFTELLLIATLVVFSMWRHASLERFADGSWIATAGRPPAVDLQQRVAPKSESGSLVATTGRPLAAGLQQPVAAKSESGLRVATTGRPLAADLQQPVGSEWTRIVRLVQSDCGVGAQNVDLSIGGGFGSKFQMASLKTTLALVGGSAARFVGHFGPYTAHQYCEETLGEVYKSNSFECFFESARNCSSPPSSAGPSAETARALERLRGVKRFTTDEADLFHAVEAYLFRFNARTRADLEQRAMSIGLPASLLSPGTSPPRLVAMHVRRGDKRSDKYNALYSVDVYVRALFKGLSNLTVGSKDSLCYLFVASDSSDAMEEVKQRVERNLTGGCRFQVVGQSKSVSQAKAGGSAMVHTLGNLKADERKAAALEIFFDIWMLSRAELLVGLMTSQIVRAAAGIRIGLGGSSDRAIGVDYENAAAQQVLRSHHYGFLDAELEGWHGAGV